MIKNKVGIFFAIVILIICGSTMYYVYFFKPKNSVELYEVLNFAENFEDIQSLILEGRVFSDFSFITEVYDKCSIF